MQPKNLEECFDELNKTIPKDFIEKLKNKTIDPNSFGLHHSLGRQMRNSWGLWSDSELKTWFNNIGIHHPDDMSAIIIDSFIKHSRNEPINLDEQVKYYQDYWEAMKTKGNFVVEMDKDGGIALYDPK